ncbi:hypothetical protein NPS01_04390 [Nocardioides psychrotolerans]|nr:hypothetical protein NPS01_04390 [Nocardioides psychrotolerans]
MRVTTPPEGPGQPYGTPEGQPGNTPYGAPQQPYGGGQQPPYGNAYPASPGGMEPPKGKGMAIAALVLAFIPCGLTTLVSLVLAIVVLAKKGGGKGLAIAAIVIDIIVVILLVALVAAGVILGGESVDSLKTGDCVTAKGLDASDEAVSQIKKVGCGEKHDGEVLATVTLSGDDVADFGDDSSNTLCDEAIAFTDEELNSFITEGYNYIGLTQTAEPESGDKLACVAFAEDGSDLTESLR